MPTDTKEEKESETPSNGGTELHRTSPTLKYAVARLIITLIAGSFVIGGLFTNPELLGSRDVTNVALLIVQVLLAIAVIRIIVEIARLRHTEYILTDRMVIRRYSLLGRTKSREIPYDLVRSTERSQGRIENFLDIGSVALNQGLGDLVLSNLPNHGQVYRIIRDQIVETPSSDELNDEDETKR